MSHNLFEKPPYFDWKIDRWKVGLTVLLFLALLLSTLIDPHWDRSAEWTAVGPLEPKSAAADAAGSEPQTSAASTPAPQDAIRVTPIALPLTLASIGPNTVVAFGSVTALSGTAGPGNSVEVSAQHIPVRAGAVAGTEAGEAETLLGATAADGRGLWTLTLADALEPGQYVISLRELDSQGVFLADDLPVVLSVLTADEEGPPSLSTPAIRFPAPAARLRAGPVAFVGSGLPGMRVRLYLDDRQVAEGVVNTREEWRITPDADLAPGVYIARTVALDPQGEIVAESPPVAFAVLDAAEGFAPQPPNGGRNVPLALTNEARWSRSRDMMMLAGRATPHSTVSAWRDEVALHYVNANVEGGWRIWLADHGQSSTSTALTVRTNLGETVRQFEGGVGEPAMASYLPALLSPRPGARLASAQPLMLGVAQPGGEIAVSVNRTVVARLVADERGQWAYQPAQPLALGMSAIAVYAEDETAGTRQIPMPVFVTVPFQL